MPTTLTGLYFGALDRFAERPAAMRTRSGGSWKDLSYRELSERVRAVSIGLLDFGIRAGDRVAILSENRPEWAIVDFACLAARAVDVPIYPTLTPKHIQYLLEDSGARVVFVSTAAQFAKLGELRGQLPKVELVVAFDDLPGQSGAIALTELERRGRAALAAHPDWRKNALSATPDDLATIIYTSGTTGEPKGVMLSHGNIASNVEAGSTVLPVVSDDECLSLLPLSHIFERMTGHYSMWQGGVIINYAESIETVARDLFETRPTVVAAVPRLYEKVHARALEAASSGAVTRQIFLWARRVGNRWIDARVEGRPVPLTLALSYAIADRLVFGKLRRRVGGRIRFFLSGGAPLAPDIARFFAAAGMPIYEGYGLTETSPVVTVNAPGAHRFGTVGRPVPGVEVRIADDGEILCRGPNIMQGYYGKPEATAEAIDPEGWFHTGDIGEVDPDGFLRITDRKKDLIATAGGKKIAPQPIEDLVRGNPFIANAVMLGDRRKFAIMLLAPEYSALEPWAREAGLTWTSREELVTLPQVQAHLEGEARKHLRDLARYEVPKKFLVVAREFSIASGELTPKLSVRRRVVESHYQAAIDALYAAAEADPNY